MRCHPDGARLELVAWGLRNAYGLGFLADGRLLAADQGADDRGDRPIPDCPDFLYHVREGAWYGWPDFFGGRPAPDFLLANHHELPPPERPLMKFPVNSSATRFAQIPHSACFAGQLIVALFGDEFRTRAPNARVGRKLVRVDPSDWSMHEVRPMVFHRPIDVAFDATDAAYVLDFGEFELTPTTVEARAASGCLWRLCSDFLEV